MSEKQKEILVNIAKAIPHMSEYKKGEFMGYAQALVDLKSERLVNEAEKEAEREEMIGDGEEK